MKASEYYRKIKGSKNLKEDALDDFDIDGSIRKSNIEAMGNENLQQAIKAYKEDCFEQVEYVAQDLLTKEGLEQVRSADPKVGQYRITCADNIFSGSVRIGSTFSIVIRLGYYWDGILPEHKKMGRVDRLNDIKRIIKEIKEEIKGRVDCQDVYDRVIDSSSSIERCAGMISVSFKITEDALGSFYESHKSNKNPLKEDGKAFSSLYKMPKVEFDKWQKATSKEGLAKTVDVDGVKACYVDEYNDTYKKMMPKHIGTWDPEEEILACDDVSLFGVELPESRRVKEAETKKTEREPVKNVAVDVFYNNNVACASRGADSDEPNKHLKFNTLGKGVDLCIATIVLEKIYDYESLEDICEALEVENKKEITLDVLTDWLDNVDYTGGDPVVFSIEIDGEKVYDGGLDPEEWENTWDDEAKEEAYDAISDELIDDYDGSAEDVDTDAIYDDVASEWDSWAKEHDPDNYDVDDFVDEFLEEHSIDDYVDDDDEDEDEDEDGE